MSILFDNLMTVFFLVPVSAGPQVALTVRSDPNFDPEATAVAASHDNSLTAFDEAATSTAASALPPLRPPPQLPPRYDK